MQKLNNINKQVWQDNDKHLAIDCVVLTGMPEQPALEGSGGI